MAQDISTLSSVGKKRALDATPDRQHIATWFVLSVCDQHHLGNSRLSRQAGQETLRVSSSELLGRSRSFEVRGPAVQPPMRSGTACSVSALQQRFRVQPVLSAESSTFHCIIARYVSSLSTFECNNRALCVVQLSAMVAVKLCAGSIFQAATSIQSCTLAAVINSIPLQEDDSVARCQVSAIRSHVLGIAIVSIVTLPS
jgi:hypothetical protein